MLNAYKMNEEMINKDHDILIEIKTKVEMLVTTVENMRNDLHSRVACLENNKVDKEEMKSIWKKLNSLENYKYYMIGMGTAILSLIVYVIKVQ